ncbi:hypothetical protein BV898_05321 [Hypsibius exemplaris]|uniref:Alpha-(1,6)-fucosyltransferase n=1 Tax=Hypsibius exemplaris TaxID=2072580 RepID=A0A1W0WZV2_HYPEX|nr:hypothetical protein BV898_05321 [Hypsibius exemplaris]
MMMRSPWAFLWREFGELGVEYRFRRRLDNLTRTLGLRTKIFGVLLIAFCTYHWVKPYSGSGGLTLTIASLLEELTYRGPFTCAAVLFRSTSSSSFSSDGSFKQEKPAEFDTVWQKRFNGTDVRDFQSAYWQNCPSLQASITTDINIRPADCEDCQTRGLANAVNLVIGSFFLAQESVDPRRIHLIGDRWNYGAWRDHFRDFTDGLLPRECSITQPVVSPNILAVKGAVNDVQLKVAADGTIRFHGITHAHFKLNVNPPDWSVFRGFVDIESQLGIPYVFQKESVIARALLIPQPDLVELIRRVWMNLVAFDGAFVTVHIRRGDKITEREAASFPVVLFYRTLKRRCLNNPGVCSRTLLLLSDDEEASRQFKAVAGDCFRITDFQSEVARLGGDNAGTWNIPRDIHTNQAGFDWFSQDTRILHAREIIISMFLMAMSEYVVCTYSSNVCRLVALLRAASWYAKKTRNGAAAFTLFRAAIIKPFEAEDYKAQIKRELNNRKMVKEEPVEENFNDVFTLCDNFNREMNNDDIKKMRKQIVSGADVSTKLPTLTPSRRKPKTVPLPRRAEVDSNYGSG